MVNKIKIKKLEHRVSECDQNTGTAARADILLPALAWGEKCGTVTNSERRISHQRQFLPHPGEAEKDWWILSQVAKRMGFSHAFNYQSTAEVFREYAALSGFENKGTRDFDISGLAKITDQEFAGLAPIQWPITAKKPKGTARLFENKHFFTVTGKAQFIAITPQLPKNSITDNYPLILNTGRVRDQWHTMTRTARSPRLNAHTPEPIVQTHPVDAAIFKLEKGAIAQLDSEWGNMLARIVISEFSDQGTQSFRIGKIVENRFDSIIFISPKHELPSRVWLSSLFSEQTLTDEMRMSLLVGKPGTGLPDIGTVICACFGVRENTIKDAVSSGSCKTVEDIGIQLKAGTNCGSCIPELKKIIAE